MPVPEAPQVASNSPVCPEDEIVLVVQNPVNLGTVDYEWVNGVGEILGTNDPTLNLATDDPAAIPPFLVKTNVNGCDSELSDPIPVTMIAMPLADAENGGAVCPGEKVQLLAAPVSNGTYSWRIAGSSQVLSFDQNPLLSVDDTTAFELVVKVNGCQSEAFDTTYVFTKEVPVITGLSGGGTHCEGSFVPLSGENGATLSGNVIYNWTGPNGFDFIGSAAAMGPFLVNIDVLQAQNEGTYTLLLTSSEGCVSEPQSLTIDYLEMPASPVISTASSILCEGETLQLDASSYSGNEVGYKWFFRDGTTDILIGETEFPTFFLPDLDTTQAGLYYVEANVDGCEPPASNLVSVEVLGFGSNVQAVNNTSVDFPVCEGGEVVLEASLIPMPATSGLVLLVFIRIQTAQ